MAGIATTPAAKARNCSSLNARLWMSLMGESIAIPENSKSVISRARIAGLAAPP